MRAHTRKKKQLAVLHVVHYSQIKPNFVIIDVDNLPLIVSYIQLDNNIIYYKYIYL